MIDFDFVSPTKIFFGKNKENLLGEILKEFNAKRILIVYGKGSIKKIGLYDKVVDILTKNNFYFVELSGIRPNPSNNSVIEGISLCKEKNIDFILALGGGSVIDTAKAIAVGVFYEGNPFDFNMHKAEPKKALPIGVVLTLAASGSELSSSCVISNDELGIKQGFNSDLIRPVFAVMNPELTYSVDKYQTGCGIVDIISHSLERYFSPSFEYEFSDDIALSIIKNTVICGDICIKEPQNYDARAAMMLNGSYSHNDLSGLGKTKQMPIHAMEHCFSAYSTTIAHGAGLSVLIPAWMNYVYKYDLDKFVKFAKDVFDVNLVSKEESAKMGIQSLKNYFKKIGMPTSLEELGLGSKDIPLLVEMMTKNGTRLIGASSIKSLNKEELTCLLTSALQEGR